MTKQVVKHLSSRIMNGIIRQEKITSILYEKTQFEPQLGSFIFYL